MWQVRIDALPGERAKREGHEQAGSRPFLVLSDDGFNQSSGAFIGVPVTSVEKPKFNAFRPRIAAGEGGLDVVSWAQTDQILMLDEGRLLYKRGRVGIRVIAEVLDRLKILLHIP
ncbi:MAG: growth inhibitor PemK [Acidobacteria bacterium]|nr:MAG: growth inhibitor PemK [Acidobacteriota bacterium]